MATRRRRDNFLILVLAVLAVLGGGHAIIDFLSADAPPPTDEPAVAVVGRAQLASSFAQQFVMTYLNATTGQQERLAEYLDNAQQVNLPKTSRQVSDPVVSYMVRTETSRSVEVWSVTVSVRLGKEGSGAISERQHYRVSLAIVAGRLRVLSLPGVVQAPRHGGDLALAYDTPCGTASPLAQVASGFIAALTAGSGDVSRYVTEESGITAVQPVPFTAVDNISVAADRADCGSAGESARVLVTFTPQSGGSASPALAYPLTMVRSAGQWQVRAVDPVPALARPFAAASGHDAGSGLPSVATSVPSSTLPVPPATQK